MDLTTFIEHFVIEAKEEKKIILKETRAVTQNYVSVLVCWEMEKEKLYNISLLQMCAS